MEKIKVNCFECGIEFEIISNKFLMDKIFAGKKIEMICETCETKQKQEKENNRIAQQRIDREIRLNKFIEFTGSRYSDCDIKNVDKKVFNFISSFEKQFDNFNKYNKKNRGLFIFGDVGIGKTYLLFALFKMIFVDKNINTIIIRMNTLLRIHHALTFGNFPAGFEYMFELNKIKGNIEYMNTSDFVRILSNIPVLIIDEMSRMKASDFNINFLIEVLDNRYSNCMVTVFCGNVEKGADIRKILISIFGDEAIVDRILDKSWNDIYIVSGTNQRR